MLDYVSGVKGRVTELQLLGTEEMTLCWQH